MSYHRDPVDVYYEMKDAVKEGRQPCAGGWRVFEVNGKEYYILSLGYVGGRTTTEYYFPKDRGE